MPIKVGGVYAEVRAENKKLKSDLRAAHKQINSFAKSSQKSLNQLSFKKVIAGLGVGALLYEIKRIGQASLAAASDLEETESKFATVFNGMNREANEMAKGLVDSYAMSSREAKQYLANVQDLLVPMGLAEKAAFKMSEQAVKLSADFASFNNLPTEDVMRNLQSALVGEFEPMRKFGVVLSAATIQQEALNSGMVQSKKDINAAVKAQAAMNIIMRSSTKAQGDQIRTMDSYANQQKQMKANWEDISASIGKQALPALAGYMKALNKLIKDIDFGDFVMNARLFFLGFVQSINDGYTKMIAGWKMMVQIFENVWGNMVNGLKASWADYMTDVFSRLEKIPFSSKLIAPMKTYISNLNATIQPQKDVLDGVNAISEAMKKRLEISEMTAESERKRIFAEQEAAKSAVVGGGVSVAAPVIDTVATDSEKLTIEEIKRIKDEFNQWKFEQHSTEMEIELQQLEEKKQLYLRAGVDRATVETETELKMAKIRKSFADAELKQRRQNQVQALSLTASFFNSLDAITGNKSKAIFLLLKSAEAAKAIVSTLSAATQALAIPPAPNFALSSLTYAAGMANVAAIGATAIGGRAIGGPVPGGSMVMVGERGPEALQMGPRSGHIIPNNRIDNTNNSRSMTVNQVNNINVSGFVDESVLKQLVRNEIAPELVEMTKYDTEGFRTDFANALAG